MTLTEIQTRIDNVERAYFYGMRTFDDRIERDELTERLECQRRYVTKIDTSRQDAIKARQRELRR